VKISKNYIIEGYSIKSGANIQPIRECIITTGRCKNDHIFIVKNRDRAYYPRGTIIHDYTKNDVERVLLLDLETAWNEGLIYNHKTKTTISIFNTALSVQDDENMKKLVSKNKTRSPDGVNIDFLLSLGDYDTIKENILNKKHAITGHTFLVELTDTNEARAHKFEIIAIETKESKEKDDENREYDLLIKDGEINLNELAVRTNHAYLLKDTFDDDGNPIDVGYTTSDDYLSSLQRKLTVETKLADETLRKTYDIQKVMDILKQKDYNFDSPLNTNRDLYKDDGEGNNIGLRTTGQLAVDLTTKTFYYDNMFNKSEILMVLNKMPDNIKPKLKVVLLGTNNTTENYDY